MADNLFDIGLEDDQEPKKREFGSAEDGTLTQEPKKEQPASFQINPDDDIETFIDRYAQFKGVNPKLIRKLRRQESGDGKNTYNPDTKATGDFQFLPSTAKRLGIDPRDPFQSAAATINEFSRLRAKWKANAKDDDHLNQLILASHHAGEGAVDEALKAGKYLPETYDKAADITTPEYVAEIWKALQEDREPTIGFTSAEPEAEQLRQTPGNVAQVPGTQFDPAAFEKMNDEQKAKYIAEQTAAAEAATPLGKGLNPMTAGIGGQFVQSDRPLDVTQVDENSEGAMRQMKGDFPTNPKVELAAQGQFDNFLREANAAYARGKETGDYSEYQTMLKTRTFAPVQFVPESDDPVYIQHKIEEAVRASARQVSADEGEIDSMIAEWRAKGNGNIQLLDPNTGQPVVPKAGQPIQAFLSAEQVFRLRKHADEVAEEKKKEIDGEITQTTAFLQGLARSMSFNGLAQRGLGAAVGVFDEKTGSDIATLGYDPTKNEYFGAGTRAEDYGILPGNPMYEKMQSRLDAGNVKGVILGEAIKLLAAHRAVGAVGRFLAPPVQRALSPIIEKLSTIPGATSITTIGGEFVAQNALRESAALITERLAHTFASSAAIAGLMVAQPETVKVDFDKAGIAQGFERGIMNAEIDPATGEIKFKKEDWLDLGKRFSREWAFMTMLGAMHFPTAKAIEVGITNPNVRNLIKPLWTGIAAERGIGRAEAEVMLNRTITNPVLVNSLAAAVNGYVVSKASHPDADWLHRVLEVSVFAGQSYLTRPGSLIGGTPPKGVFYAKDSETGQIYKATALESGVEVVPVKDAPKGEVFEATSKDDLDIWAASVVHQFGNEAQRNSLNEYINNPDITSRMLEAQMKQQASAMETENGRANADAARTEPARGEAGNVGEEARTGGGERGRVQSGERATTVGGENAGRGNASNAEAVPADVEGTPVTSKSQTPNPYRSLTEGNRELVEKLYESNLTTPESKADIQKLYEYADAHGIERKHVGALIADMQNYQINQAREADVMEHYQKTRKPVQEPAQSEVVEPVEQVQEPVKTHKPPSITTNPSLKGKVVGKGGKAYELTGDVIERRGVRFVKAVGKDGVETYIEESDALRPQSFFKAGLDVNPHLEAEANEYAEAKKGKSYKVGEYYDFDPRTYIELADIGESAPHEPNKTEVKKAYDAMMRETVDQFNYLKSKGAKFEAWKNDGQPYANSAEMRADVTNNRRLYFFTGGDMPADHPLAKKSGIFDADGYEYTYNDIFRAVHDWFGHAVTGAQFGARGEFNATDSHARMYSEEALPALIGETILQNAWVNYGRHIRRPDGTIPVKGDPDFIHPADRPYAEQKAIDVNPEIVAKWRQAYKSDPLFKVQSIFDEGAPAKPGLKDRARLAVTRFKIDAATRNLDVTDLGKAVARDNVVYLDPVAARDFAVATQKAFEAGEFDTAIQHRQMAGVTNTAEAFRNVAKFTDNVSLREALNSLSDGQAVVMDAYRNDRALTQRHETIHRNVAPLPFKDTAFVQLGETPAFKQLRTELESKSGFYSGRQISDYELVHEAIAFGLTGDYASLGVGRKTLYDATTEALKRLAADNPQFNPAELRSLALSEGKKIINNLKNYSLEASTFGDGNARTYARQAQKAIDELAETSPDILVDARTKSPAEFNADYADAMPIAERRAVLIDAGADLTQGELFDKSPVKPKPIVIDGVERNLYDINADREGLFIRARGDMNDLRKYVQKAGYEGYYDGNPDLPLKVEPVFVGEPVATKKTPVPKKMSTPLPGAVEKVAKIVGDTSVEGQRMIPVRELGLPYEETWVMPDESVKGKIKMVNVDNLILSRDDLNSYRLAKAAEIVEKGVKANGKLMPLEVYPSRKSPGKYVTGGDGNHRTAAAKLAGYKGEVPVKVFEGKTTTEQPSLFRSEAPSLEQKITSGDYVMMSGNQSEVQTPADIERTKQLKAELVRKGFTVHDAEGNYLGTIENSLMVEVKNSDEVDLLRAMANMYKQKQVFVARAGKFTVPFTDGVTMKENFSKTGEVLFGKKALGQDGHTTVTIDGKKVTFSLPDAYANERAMRLTPKQQKLMEAVANEAQYKDARGFSWNIKERAAELPKVSSIGEAFEELDIIYGRRFERKGRLDESDAVNRFVTDWTETVRQALDSGAEGKNWYSDDINQMFSSMEADFPGISKSDAARAAFATMMAVTSPRQTVRGNFEISKDVFRRFLKSMGNFSAKVPIKQESGDEYGVFTSGLRNLDRLMNGYVWNPETRRMEFSKFQYQQVRERGMAGIFDYLMSPGTNREFVAQEMFGYKVGSFLMNLRGNTEVPTIDSWIVRAWRLNNGDLFNAKGELNDSLSEGTGNRIRGSVQSIAARLRAEGYDVSPTEVQAVIWMHLKGTVDAMTGRRTVPTFSESAAKSQPLEKPSPIDKFSKRFGLTAGEQDPMIGEGQYIRQANSKTRLFFRAGDDMLTEPTGKKLLAGEGVERYREGQRDRFIIRGEDGTVIAAADVVDQAGSKKIVNYAVADGLENTGTVAMLTARIKKSFPNAEAIESEGLARENAFVVPDKTLAKANFPTDEDGWVDAAEKLKGQPLSAQEETAIRSAYAQNPNENAMVLAISQFKQSFPEFLLKVYKAGLLSGVGTHVTNTLSNTSMIALEEAAKVPTALLDAIVSSVSGRERTALMPTPKAWFEGLKGVKEYGWVEFKKSLQGGDFDNFYQIPAQSGIPVLDKSVGKLADYVFRFVAAQDKLFKGYAFRRTLYEQAVLEERAGGRKVADVMQNPHLEQVDMALRAAAYVTFQRDNFISDKYTELKGFAQKKAMPLSWFLDLNLPFVKTGTNVAMNAIDYMGLTGLVETAHQVHGAINMKSWGETKQNIGRILDNAETRSNIQQMSGRGFIGMALLYAGWKLAEAGILTADYDDNDKKQINEMGERNAPFLAVKVGERFVPFSRIMPAGAFFAAGARAYAHRDEGVNENLADMGKLLVGQFPLGKFSQKVYDKDTKVTDFLIPRGSSMVPAIVRDFARYGDVKRDTKVRGDVVQTFINEMKSSIPGARKSLPPKTTALGYQMTEGDPILGTTQARDSELIKELSRLDWFPAKYGEGAGGKFVERPMELRGQVREALEEVVASPEYKAEDDTVKKSLLQKATGIILDAWAKDHKDPAAEERKKAKRAEGKQQKTIIREILDRNK